MSESSEGTSCNSQTTFQGHMTARRASLLETTPEVPLSSRQAAVPRSPRPLWPQTQTEVSAPRMPEIHRAPTPGPTSSDSGSSGATESLDSVAKVKYFLKNNMGAEFAGTESTRTPLEEKRAESTGTKDARSPLAQRTRGVQWQTWRPDSTSILGALTLLEEKGAQERQEAKKKESQREEECEVEGRRKGRGRRRRRGKGNNKVRQREEEGEIEREEEGEVKGRRRRGRG
ncbi:hypothetical protein ACLB2K_066864 [Fragaria x ananassa]